MPTATYAGTEVNRQRRGVLHRPAQWREEMAPQIAAPRASRAHRAALAGHQVHAPRVRGQGHRADRPGARQDLRRDRQGALPAVPARARPRPRRRSPGSPSPAAASEPHAERKGGHDVRQDREGLHHHLQGLAGGRLPGPDHGQRGPGRRDGGEPVLHLLRPRRRSTRPATSTSSSPPSATPACTWPPGPVACPASPPS